MDKEIVPWSPARLLACALAPGICAGLIGLGRRARGAWRGVAILFSTAIALVWASAGAVDDFFSPDVGPGMRRELGTIAHWYGMALLLESAIPMVVVVTLLDVRTEKRKQVQRP